MIRGIFGPGTIVLGGAAALMILFLVVGFLLPKGWEAEASGRLDATPKEIMAFLDSPEGWQAWTAWPDSGVVRSGPARGPGAKIAWDDPELGSGTFTIVTVHEGSSVSYSVEVAGVASALLRTRGSVTVAPVARGALVRWSEEGDLGRNPLMGYWALSMKRAQGTEMGKGLDRLGEVVREARGPGVQPAPADSSLAGTM
jgi:polyketide cyclase/dehydrase/lipid transport protein